MLKEVYIEHAHVYIAHACRGDDESQTLLDIVEKIQTIYKRSENRELFVFVKVDKGHQLPDAMTRKKSSLLGSTSGSHMNIAIISHNNVFRTVLTALNWVSAGNVTRKAFSEADEAIAWCMEKTPVSKEELSIALMKTNMSSALR